MVQPLLQHGWRETIRIIGLSFGMRGIGTAALGWLAPGEGIVTACQVCAFLPEVERDRRA